LRKNEKLSFHQQPIEALLWQNNLNAFFFGTKGTKKKALQKRNADFVGRRPTPRKLLKKLDQNFCCLV